jgi:DNA-binding CsgD family transcriptional regulator
MLELEITAPCTLPPALARGSHDARGIALHPGQGPDFAAPASTGPTAPHAPTAPTGPTAPTAPLALGALLVRVLDELDVGVVLLGSDAEVLHLNHRAHRQLGGALPLQVLGGQLRSDDPVGLARLHDALRDATQRGLRRLLAVGRGDDRQLAALVPVQPGMAALLLGRTQVCEDLALQCFAREHALTAAETRVLAALGRGQQPGDIAREQGVKISTVRTQIGAIRGKTGAGSITALVRLVAGLPPMVSVLRG